MSNKYFIWKESNCNGINPTWIEISGSQFFALVKDKTQKRYFKKIDDDEEGTDVFVFETTYEEYKEWHKEQERKRRKRKAQSLYKPEIVSMDDNVSNTEFTYNDIVPDEDVDIENTLIKENELYRLRGIIENLSGKEKIVIDIMIEAHNSGSSERTICRKRGVDQGTFVCRKKKLFKKIKTILNCE